MVPMLYAAARKRSRIREICGKSVARRKSIDPVPCTMLQSVGVGLGQGHGAWSMEMVGRPDGDINPQSLRNCSAFRATPSFPSPGKWCCARKKCSNTSRRTGHSWSPRSNMSSSTSSMSLSWSREGKAGDGEVLPSEHYVRCQTATLEGEWWATHNNGGNFLCGVRRGAKSTLFLVVVIDMITRDLWLVLCLILLRSLRYVLERKARG